MTIIMFQSSFELTGYITTEYCISVNMIDASVSKLFRAYRLYNEYMLNILDLHEEGFKALSSLQVI